MDVAAPELEQVLPTSPVRFDFANATILLSSFHECLDELSLPHTFKNKGHEKSRLDSTRSNTTSEVNYRQRLINAKDISGPIQVSGMVISVDAGLTSSSSGERSRRAADNRRAGMRAEIVANATTSEAGEGD